MGFAIPPSHISRQGYLAKRKGRGRDKDKKLDASAHSVLAGAIMIAAPQNISNAYAAAAAFQSASESHQVATPFASMQLASASLSAPIGELQDASSTTAMNPAFNSFGQWFFVMYVVVSLLAGGKEVASRIKKQMDKKTM